MGNAYKVLTRKGKGNGPITRLRNTQEGNRAWNKYVDELWIGFIWHSTTPSGGFLKHDKNIPKALFFLFLNFVHRLCIL
jgi:hypothetical protein